MNWNTLLFLIFPYVATVLAVVVTVYRSIYRPFTVSSLSSQLLERKKLYWGSIPFHYGVVLILLMHLLALVFPKGLQLWNAVPIRLYLLEFSGLALGIWSLVGLVVLIWRRASDARVRTVTTRMDVIVLLLLLVSMISGVLTATNYRFGSTWFTAVFSPYLWSLITLRPQPELVAPLPWIVQLHALNYFVLLFAFPFSRLVHIATLPLGYLIRPWQVVIWVREAKARAD